MTTRPPHLYEAAHAAYVDAEGRHGGGPEPIRAVLEVGYRAGVTAALDGLPADDDAIVAWLHRHGLTTSAGPGAVLAAVRADLNPATA